MCKKSKNTVNDHDKKPQNKKKINFYHVLFFGIIPIIIVSVLVGKSVYITMLAVECEELTNAVNSNADLLNTGLAIVGIAVSVWVGINISNLVDRQLIENLKEKVALSEETIQGQIKKQDALKEELKNTNIDIENKFYKMQFLNELIKTRFLYESSAYFYEFFERTEEKLDYKFYFQAESCYSLCTDAYEHNEWEKSYDYACEGLQQLENAKEVFDKEYFQLRKGDFLFYKNVNRTHSRKQSLENFSVEEMEESINLYKKSGLQYSSDSGSSEEQKMLGYIYNTIGYSYDLLSRHRNGSEKESEEDKNKRKEKIEENLRDAEYYMELAVRNNPKGRYYRNWGLTYQHSGNFARAKECYINAFKADPRDYKAYNNFLALILRELDSKLNIGERHAEGTEKLLSEFSDARQSIDDTLKKELKWADKYRELAEEGNFWFEDIHYNTCKMYMYFYILSDYENKDYIREAINYGNKALLINKSSVGAKFCLRNAYEAAGNLMEAEAVNNELKNNGKPIGDSMVIGEMYKHRKNKSK